MKNKFLKTFCLGLLGLNVYCSDALEVGDSVADITFTDFKTGEVKTLDEFGGSVLVLDYFAYWCAPCELAAAKMLVDIEEYYEQNGGNPSGLPVEIISIDVEDEYNFATLAYAVEYKISHLMASESVGLYEQLGSGGIPFFAIVNADPNSTTAEYGEILYVATGFGEDIFKDEFRPVIDGVESAVLSQEPIIFRNPASNSIETGGFARLTAYYTAEQPVSIQWFKNGEPLDGGNNRTLIIEDFQYANEGAYHIEISNAFGEASSTSAILSVKESFTHWLNKNSISGDDVRSKDDDNDGAPNYLEYILGTDPALHSDSSNLEIAEASVSEGGNKVRLRYRISNRAFAYARQLFVSEDLVNWVRVENQDLEETIVGNDLNSKLFELAYSQNDGTANKFFSLGFSDQNQAEILRVGDSIIENIDELDLEIDEGVFVDIFNFSGFEDGQPVTVKVDTTSSSPGFFVNMWMESDRSDGRGISYYGEGFDSVQFVVDGDANYTLKVSNYTPFQLSSYKLTVEAGEIYKDVEVGVELFDEKTDHAFGENTYVRKYKIINPPYGKLLAVQATPKENLEGETPLVRASVEDPSLGRRYYGTTGGDFYFVPSNIQDSAITVHNIDGWTFADYDLKIDLSDRFPNIEMGDTLQVQNTSPLTYSNLGDEPDLKLGILLLQGLVPEIPVQIDVDGSIDDTRVLILNATNYSVVFKDIPAEVKSSETLTFTPKEGQYYFIAVGSTDLDNIGDFTVTVRSPSKQIGAGDIVPAVLDESDFELDTGIFEDLYAFSGLEDGQSVTIKLDTSSSSTDFHIDMRLESNRSEKVGSAYHGEGFASVQFVVDGEADYKLHVMNLIQNELGSYQLSIETGEVYKEIEVGEELLGESTDHAFGENSFVRKYKIVNPPYGQSLTVQVTPKENADGVMPLLRVSLEDPSVGGQYYGMTGTFSFVPSSSQESAFTIHNTDGWTIADYDLKVVFSDEVPDLGVGESIQVQNSSPLPYTNLGDESPLRLQLLRLQGLKSKTPVQINVDGGIDDTRVLILNATTYALVSRDLPGEINSSEILTFMPKAGQHYFLAVGSDDLENIADFTVTMKRASEVIKVGDSLPVVLDEFDFETSEGIFEDIYSFSGLEDGQPITIKVDTTSSLPGFYVNIWLESDRSEKIGYSYYGDGFDSLQFVVDGEANYYLHVSNYNAYSLGSYQLSVEAGEFYKEIEVGDELLGEKTDHAFGENTYVRKYKIINPPYGQVIAVQVTPKENAEGDLPEISTYFDKPSIGGTGGFGTTKILKFVPSTGQEAAIAITASGLEVANYDLKVVLFDGIPNLGTGETVHTQNSDPEIFSNLGNLRSEKFRLAFLLLQGLTPNIPVQINVDGSIEDARVLVLNASNYSLVAHDQPEEIESNVTVTFIPEEGKYYFVAVGSTDLDDIADFTITVNPQVVDAGVE